MAVLDNTRPTPAGFGLAGRAFTLFTAVIAHLAERRAEAVTRRALLKLSDHQLTDIGLARADVERLSYRIMH